MNRDKLATICWLLAAVIGLPSLAGAWWQSVPQVAISGGAAATEWSTTDKSAQISLSGSNLTATLNSSTGALVRANNGASSGQKYYEITNVARPTAFSDNPGVANATESVNVLLGTTGNGGGVLTGGQWFMNSATPFTLTGWVQGDSIDIAVDLNLKRVWNRVNGGAWSQSGDPVAGTNGGDISSIVSGTVYPALGMSITGTIYTANFGPSFSRTPPTGYTAW